MPNSVHVKRRSVMLLLPTLLLMACASKPAFSPAPVAPPAIPPLPLAARQPATEPVCLPTCSASLQRALTNWQSRLTAPALPASSASQPTTR